jgi:hypothetical protein
MATGGPLYERGVRLAHRGYKLTLSPLFGQSCRFLPTCSDYGRDALIQHGPLKGGWLTVRRLCKCHPLGKSGYDPVPPKSEIGSDAKRSRSDLRSENDVTDR